MKKLKSKLVMQLSDSEDVNRSLKVSVDSDGEYVNIGSGRNTDYPQLAIPREDVETLIKLLTEAIVHKLPTEL